MTKVTKTQTELHSQNSLNLKTPRITVDCIGSKRTLSKEP